MSQIKCTINASAVILKVFENDNAKEKDIPKINLYICGENRGIIMMINHVHVN